MSQFIIRWSKRIAIVLAIMILLIGSIGYIIARIMEDDVTDIVIKELNKNLTTTIQASKIRLSFLRKFPKASVEFSDVVALSPRNFSRKEFGGQGDTLFWLKSIFLEFNVREIFSRNIKVRNIHALKGKIWVLTASDKSCNYIFWKTDKKSDTSSFNINLQNVKLNEIGLILEDKKNELTGNFYLESLSLRGNFSSEIKSIYSSGRIRSNYFLADSNEWFPAKDLSLDLEMQIRDTAIFFPEIRVKTGPLLISGKGNLNIIGSSNLDFSLATSLSSLEMASSILPEGFRNAVKTYSISGNGVFDVRIYGKTTNPSVKVDFATQAAGVQYPGRPPLRNLEAQGYYQSFSKGKDTISEVVINSFSSALGDGNISGNLQLRNLDHPFISFSLNFNAELNDLQQLAVADSLYRLKGRAEGSLKGSGFLGTIDNPDIRNLATWNFFGSAKITNGFINDWKNKLVIDEAEGKIFIGESLRLEDFNILTRKNRYRINAEIPDIAKWLFLPRQNLRINGNVYARELNFNSMEDQGAAGERKEPSPFVFPDSLYLNLDLSVGKINLGRFTASGISGNLTYQPYMFVIHSMNASTMNGSLSGGAILLQRFNKDILFRTQSSLKDIDIQNLFYSFRNFGQNSLTDQNLKGNISGNVNMQAEWDPFLNVKQESILAESTFEIDNGELIQFEPMKGLSKFIEVSELDHIYFKQLKNEIFIRNRTITIPAMDINSSAFNIKGSGEHTFDNNFTYNIQVSLSDVLANKAKKARKENVEFGIVEQDDHHQMSLYLVIAGNMEDYKVRYDTKNALKGMKSSFTKEKTDFKSIFRNEFGKKNNDSIPSLNNSGQDSKKNKFNLEFEDGKATERDIKKQDQTKKNNNKFHIEWDEENADSNSIKK